MCRMSRYAGNVVTRLVWVIEWTKLCRNGLVTLRGRKRKDLQGECTNLNIRGMKKERPRTVVPNLFLCSQPGLRSRRESEVFGWSRSRSRNPKSTKSRSRNF